MHTIRTSHAPRRSRPWTSIPTLLLALASCLVAASPAAATFLFADLAAERNLAPEGFGNESFAFGGDRVNRFNGALGVTVELGDVYPVGGHLSYSLSLHYTSNLWRFDASGPVTAVLDERFNAGAGWSLSFGELAAPATGWNPSSHWVYRSPTGRLSRFHDTLTDGDAPVAGVLYTRDGTLLRLTVDSSQATVARLSGTTQRFDLQTDGSWRFSEERDLFGNWLTATYLAGEIRLTDRHGRVQKLFLQADPAGSGREVIDRVELTAFGGATAVYELHYSTQTVELPPQDDDPATPAQATVAVLTAVERPDGTETTFEYAAIGGFAAPASGRLVTLGLPTGGFLDYGYRVVELPKVPGALHTADVVGVSSRAARVPVTGKSPAIQGSWTFTTSLDRDRDATGTDKPRELTTRVTYPDGHYRDYKFSAFAGGDPANDENPPTNFFLRDYAFPFTKAGAVAGDPFYTTVEIYESTGERVRSDDVRYQWGSCSGCWDQHPRVSGHRTVYEDGSGRVETRAFQLDDLGRRLAAHSYDNAGEVPMRSTTFVHDHGVPAATAPWVAAGWNEWTVQEGSESMKRQRCVDPATGQVTRERTLAGNAPAAHDLLRVHEYHATGERSVTRHYGGDVQPLATGDLCTLALPASEQYVRFWSYQYGTLAAEGWLAADGSTFLQSRSATIDPDTGLVASSSGADGFTWSSGYDALGRLIAATPPAGHGGATTTLHQPPAGTDGAITAVTVTGADGTELSKTETELDPFGRATTVRRWSDSGWRTTTRSYDAQGRLRSTTGPDGGTTQRLDLDAFGRPATVRPPEGSVHDRSYAYLGRAVSETVKIGKEWDELTNDVVEIDRTITTRTDRFGRRLEEQVVDADGEHRTTTYTLGLDGGVRTTIVTDGVRTETVVTPDRTDNRGFTVETPDGEPITGYDALGNLTEVDHGEGPVFQLYDRAGRLVEQRADSVAGPLWAQNVYAASSAGNDYRGGKLVSSLRINRDLPHLPSSEVHVTDTYSYTGDGGGLAELRTTVTSGSQTIFSFVTSRAVDASGEVSSLTFPECDPATNDGFSLCEPRAQRVMASERSYGEPTGFDATVGGVNEPWVDAVVRDAAGRPTQTQLGNGIVEDRVYGADGRLESLTLSHAGSGSFYYSGVAQYDGLGKLVKLGTQRHVSENAYRLTLPAPPTPGNPGDVTTPSVPTDRLGQRTRRAYRVPYRWDPASSQWEEVTEVYVYGPGNRLVWNRRFNDYQAATYRNSEDLWYLTDPAGRTVREVTALTYYAGTAPQWSNAQASGVWMHVAGNLTDDSIVLGGELIGNTTDVANSPARTFLHRDFFGRLFAESAADGTVEAEEAPLF